MRREHPHGLWRIVVIVVGPILGRIAFRLARHALDGRETSDACLRPQQHPRALAWLLVDPRVGHVGRHEAVVESVLTRGEVGTHDAR